MFIVPKSELRVAPLSGADRRWVSRLRRCLEACPERIDLLTQGDSLMVVDHDGARRSELSDGQAHADGVVLAYLPGPVCHGVS
jgi:hypothetical protein